MALKDETASGPATGLRRDAIGLREVLLQSITDMAPGATIAASIPAGALYAGGALPLSVLLALAACLLSASCIGLLARELPSAGSLATYADTPDERTVRPPSWNQPPDIPRGTG